jgi:hypothetical protein
MCPICGSESRKVRSFAKRGEERLNLRECLSCHQQFLNPYPSDEWLAEEYSHYFIKRQAGLVRAKTDYFEALFRKLNLNFKQNSILEFGPGEGDSLAAVRRLGNPEGITVVERNDEAAELLKDLDCSYYNMFLEEYLAQDPDRTKFDYIFLFDVLEHLKDPVGVLKNLKEKKLKSQGSIIATFPVSDSLSRKVLGTMWPQYKVEHLNYFTDKSIEIMASKSGLSLRRNEALIKTLSLEYLLNVGKGFGPQSFKSLSSKIEKLTPKKLQKINVSMGYGEKLVVLQN